MASGKVVRELAGKNRLSRLLSPRKTLSGKVVRGLSVQNDVLQGDQSAEVMLLKGSDIVAFNPQAGNAGQMRRRDLRTVL